MAQFPLSSASAMVNWDRMQGFPRVCLQETLRIIKQKIGCLNVILYAIGPFPLDISGVQVCQQSMDMEQRDANANFS